MQKNIEKYLTVLAPKTECTQFVNQNDQTNDTISDSDKYALDLRFCPRHRLRIKEAKNCPIFKVWDQQMLHKFGFIPLQDQILRSKDQRNPSMTDVLKLHKIFSNSDTHNFLECQIHKYSPFTTESGCLGEVPGHILG